MLDSIFKGAAAVLDFFYGLVPNYAIAIMLMTLLVMAVTTPLTLKGTRGMIKMQLLQPELKKIQEKHKGGDRQEMNAELMAFYQENNLNPLGGCLPLLIQAPVFLLLYRLIGGLTSTGEGGGFDPKYLDHTSDLYQALEGKTEMKAFGLDLAESTSSALGESIIHGLPYLILILVMIGAQYFQQRQVSARNPQGQVTMPQQKILLRVMPAFFGIISINFPAALVVYWVTSSVCRIGLQAYITRSLYAGEDSIGAQAQAAAARARALKGNDTSKDEGSAAPTREAKAGRGRADKADKADKATKTSAKEASAGNGKAPPPPIGGGSRVTPAGSGRAQPSSKKKKRKKR